MKKQIPLIILSTLSLMLPPFFASADDDELEAFSEPTAPRARTVEKQRPPRRPGAALDISMSADLDTETPVAPAPPAHTAPARSQAPDAPQPAVAGAFQQALSDSLTADGIKFTQKDRIITILYKLRNCTTRVGIIFAKDNGTQAKVYALPFAKPEPSDQAAVIALCNTFNAKYKWCKFYLSDTGIINMDIDVRLPEGNPEAAAKLCRASIKSMNAIVDAVYPQFMELLPAQGTRK